MQIGIIRLPSSNKTTIFNALVLRKIETAAYSPDKSQFSN